MKLFGWLIPPWAKLAAIPLALGGAFSLGWHERGIRCENARLEALEAQRKAFDRQLAKANEAAADYEQTREQGRIEYRTREGQVRTIYETVEVPASCAAPDSVRSVLNEAVDSANASAR